MPRPDLNERLAWLVANAGTNLIDDQIILKEILKLKKELYDIIAQHSGKPFADVERDSDRDYWMTSEEAKAYGMIDEVLTAKNPR